MAKHSRKIASRLGALSLALGLCAACPGALAQTRSDASNARADASSKPGREAAQDARVARACNALRDGRGEQVVSGGPVEAPVGKECVAEHARRRPPVAKVQEAPALTAGAAQSDRSDHQQRGESTAIVPKLSAGRLSATVLTTGTAILLLQSSLSTYLLILGLPFWRHVDLLPIVDATGGGEAEPQADAGNADEERAVGHVLDPQGRERGGSEGCS